MTRPPSTSGSGSGFDVEPSELSTVAKSVALQQGMLHKAANDLVYDLVEFMDCGGYGTAAEMVSAAYVKVGNRFLDVWAKTVTSVGGVAVGFVTTANNYSMAEAASHPSGNAPPVQFPLPQVIDTPPRYQRIPDPKWGDMDDYSSGLISWLLEGVPDWAMDIVRDLLDNVYRWGKAGDILPLPDYLQLDKIALAWLKPGFAITQIESTLTWTIGSISDPNNGEWQAAMRQFASSLWGTTAWGTSTAGYEWKHDSAGGQGAGSHPVMSVLWDTTQEVSQIMRAYAEAGEKMGREVARVYREAVWDALPDIADGLDMNDVKKIGKGILGLGRELGIGITLKIDTGAINAAVSLYEGELLGLTSDLNRLIPALDEAYRSAPTYHSEEARSQAFGARSLNEFKPEHHFSVPGQDPDDIYYPMDLAAQEGMFGSHPIDKHVGLTDDQMIMRLRDQPNVPDASSFTDLPSAQKYTQDVLRDDANENRIAAWIDSVEKRSGTGPGTTRTDPRYSRHSIWSFPGNRSGARFRVRNTMRTA